jgi:hypothetical protein
MVKHRLSLAPRRSRITAPLFAWRHSLRRSHRLALMRVLMRRGRSGCGPCRRRSESSTLGLTILSQYNGTDSAVGTNQPASWYARDRPKPGGEQLAAASCFWPFGPPRPSHSERQVLVLFLFTPPGSGRSLSRGPPGRSPGRRLAVCRSASHSSGRWLGLWSSASPFGREQTITARCKRRLVGPEILQG